MSLSDHHEIHAMNNSRQVPAEPVSKNDFKTIMSRLAASVTVVTTAHGESLHGMTATAVCSVSDSPPSLLVVVNRTSRSHSLISQSGVFVVNVLSHAQEALASRFASKEAKEMDIADYRRGATGAPILVGADAFAECEIVRQMEFGTHTIFVGKIVAAESNDVAPLIYHQGQFRMLRDR